MFSSLKHFSYFISKFLYAILPQLFLLVKREKAKKSLFHTIFLYGEGFIF